MRANQDFTKEENHRYQRHFQLPEVGKEGQLKLKSAKILIVGMGGLGSPAALYLAAAGVGTLGLMDFDTVSISNLQRQILYQTPDQGQLKVEVAARQLKKLNPHTQFNIYPFALDKSQAEKIALYDLVIDASDNLNTRYLLNDACTKYQTPWVYASIYRFEGQLSFFNSPETPCYRCLYLKPPPPEAVPNCSEGGVLGVLPGILGTQQALEALKYLLNIGTLSKGVIRIFDTLWGENHQMKLPQNSECPICTIPPEAISLDSHTSIFSIQRSAYTLKESLSNPDTQWVDVRTQSEREIDALPSIHLPLDELLLGKTSALSKTSTLIIYCQSGMRSQRATSYLLEQGFNSVYNLQGGMNAWRETFPD